MTNIFADILKTQMAKTVGKLLKPIVSPEDKKPLQGTIFEDYEPPESVLPEGTEIDLFGEPTGPYGGAFQGAELGQGSKFLQPPMRLDQPSEPFVVYGKGQTPFEEEMDLGIENIKEKYGKFTEDPSVGRGLGLPVAVGETFFAPFTAAFKEAKKVPVAGEAVKGLEWLITQTIVEPIDYALQPVPGEAEWYTSIKQDFFKPLFTDILTIEAFRLGSKGVKTGAKVGADKIRFKNETITAPEFRQVSTEARGGQVKDPVEIKPEKRAKIEELINKLEKGKEAKILRGKESVRIKTERNLIADIKAKWNELFKKEAPAPISDLIDSAHPKNLEKIDKAMDKALTKLKERGGISDTGLAGLKGKEPNIFGDILKNARMTNLFKDDMPSDMISGKEDGMLLYHGSKNKFTDFKPELIGTNDNASVFGKGFYFSETKSQAQKYGDNVGEFYVDIKNPLKVANTTEDLKNIQGSISAKDAKQLLFNKEIPSQYDGVQVFENGKMVEVVAKNNSQIKSKAQTETPKDISSERAEAEAQEREALERESVTGGLSPFTDDTIKLFDKIRRYKDSAYADGDIETMRKNPTWGAQIESAVEKYNEATGQDLVDTEAFEEIMNLPNLIEKKVAVRKAKFAKKVKPAKKVEIKPEEPVTLKSLKDKGQFTTRKIKSTSEFNDFVEYAESIQGNDINQGFPLEGRWTSLTIDRMAEQLDGQIRGRIYNEIVNPVWKAAVEKKVELKSLSDFINRYKIIEGSKLSEQAFDIAEGKIEGKNKKAKELASFARDLYDDLLDRINKKRAMLGLEDIPKRKNYVTHIIEMNTLNNILGSYEKMSRKNAIKQIKKRLMDKGVDESIAFQRAKRTVEGSQGLEMYIDAKQPTFKYAKQRLAEEAASKDIIKSLKAYIDPALQYIYQAENVAKNKAYKDVLPLHAKIFVKQWNTEQVASISPANTFNQTSSRVINSIRNTVGQNIILGNIATMMMQLTSVPQVIATAGMKNYTIGLVKRLQSYIPGQKGLYEFSDTKKLRSLHSDIGVGDTIVDEFLGLVGKIRIAKDPAARTRHMMKLGRNVLAGMLEGADQFTVGTTFEAFYNQGIKDKGYTPEQAFDFADTQTGRTQANYFKEGLPPILNTQMGRVLGQFGTYGLNQWEMLRKDIGKEYIKDGDFKSKKNARTVAKQFFALLVSAYIVDNLSERLFNRTPFDIKPLVDSMLNDGPKDIAKQFVKTAFNFIPFFASVKFDSFPPVGEFFSDVLNAVGGNEENQKKAIDNLRYKWVWLLGAPAGGGQAKKTLEAVEANTGMDIPFIDDKSKTASGKTRFDIESFGDTLSSYLFGVYSTAASQKYFEKFDKKSSSSKETTNYTFE